MEAPQNRRFYGKMECIPLWPGRTLGKTYGIKLRCYWEHPWGTYWELEGNMLGRKEKRKTILTRPHRPPATQNSKEKNQGPLSACQASPLAAHEISISRTICHHLWPGLIPPL